MTTSKSYSPKRRQNAIIKTFTSNYGDMIAAESKAWKKKFRKMSLTPFTFYRGSAALFYSDMSKSKSKAFLDKKTSRIWIHGDLHAQNFGTYMNMKGELVFAVNDFDEAFVGPYIWDLKRLAASLKLIGYEKALSDKEITKIVVTLANSYSDKVRKFAKGESSRDFALTLNNTTGKVKETLLDAKLQSRVEHLKIFSEIKNYNRQFKIGKINHKLSATDRKKVKAAFNEYLQTIPAGKRQEAKNAILKDLVESKGIGIGSAGYKCFTVLMEGPNEALENDIVLSMKEGQTPSVSRIIKDRKIHNHFLHNGHRTVLSQRALQTHADPWLGYTSVDGIGLVVSELSPYNNDLEWEDVNEMEDLLELTNYLGQAVAKIHCLFDVDSDQSIVNFSTDQAIHGVLKGKKKEFQQYLVKFAHEYGEQVREDYNLFVDAFRNHMFDSL